MGGHIMEEGSPNHLSSRKPSLAAKNKKKKLDILCWQIFHPCHGKKQEVMVKAFKNLYDKGYRDWQLHLVGGLGREPSSVRFMEDLRKPHGIIPFSFMSTRPEKNWKKYCWLRRYTGMRPDMAKTGRRIPLN
jgi:hypothetical protein